MRRVAAAALAAALLAGCAADLPEDEPVRRIDALTWTEDTDPDLDGVPLAVGSESGPVDELLGWLAVEALLAAGADVTEMIPVGDVEATREAQLAGIIDLYWETTGTGWLDLLRETGPSQDPEQLHRDVRDEDLDENGILWLPPAPADAGTGIVAAPDVAEELGIAGLRDLAEALDATEPDVFVCVAGAGQPLDPGGLAALAEAADVRIRPRVVNPVAGGQLVALVEDGFFCPFALVNRLDPRLDGAEVEFLEDDVGAFVAQNPAVTIREDTHDLASGVEDLLEPLTAALDTATLRRLVGNITQDDHEPRSVARDWLVNEGFARF